MSDKELRERYWYLFYYKEELTEEEKEELARLDAILWNDLPPK